MTNQIIKSTAKATVLCVLLFIAGSFRSLAQTDTWVQKNDFAGTARQGAVGFSIGNKGYLGTGNDGNLMKEFWEYDFAANTWSQRADFGGTARTHSAGFSIGSKGYIGTGVDIVAVIYFKDFWEYDQAFNTWTQKADFGGTARKNAVGFSIVSKGYIGTGYADGTGLTKGFWEYDPAADTWAQKADLDGAARYRAVGFSIGSNGYVGTGSDLANNSMRDFWGFDPVADAWTQKADLGGAAREKAVGFSIGSKGYLGTGNNGNTNYRDLWEYDAAANTWEQKADFGGVGRRYAIGFSIGNKGYLGTGGDKDNLYKDFWEYDPGIILPISFTSFTATKQATSVLLNWHIATETNNAYFSVEHSNNSNDFSAIGQVKGKGNSTALQLYNFTDVLPFTGNNYYRLKAIDKDGSFHYSDIVLVNVANDKTITIVYPVPAKDILYIQTNGNASFSLVNQMGKILLTKTINGTGSINVGGFAAGLYYLKNNGSGAVQKVVILR